MNDKNNLLQSTLLLRKLKLNIHLGWTETERRKKQPVTVDIMIHFPNPPNACITDTLENTYCYDSLVKKINLAIADRYFRLIEHLAYTIYELTRSSLTENENIQITITKKPNLSRQIPIAHVSFSYGNIKP